MASFRARRRKILGKKVKALRKAGCIPAVLSFKGQASIPLTLEGKEFFGVYSEMGEASLATLEFDSQKVEVIVSEIERDPISGAVLHIGFQKVRRGEKITASVPVKVVGESPVVKRGEGMLLVVLSELEVECLPRDLFSELEVDISGLSKVDDAVTVGGLSLDWAKVEVLGHAPGDVVVKIAEAEMEEVEEGVEEVPVEEIEATEEKSVEKEEEAGEAEEATNF